MGNPVPGGLDYRFIEVQGYRSLASVRLELRGLNVLVGPNGSGKTSFLDVFQLLGEGARMGLSQGISRRGGLAEILTQGKTSLRIELQTDVGRLQRLKYWLQLRTRGGGYEISEEVLSPYHPEPYKWIDSRPGHPRYHDGTGLIAPNWEYEEAEPALAQVPKIYETAESFRSRLGSVRAYAGVDVRPEAPIRGPQDLDPFPRIPGPNGEHLVAALYNMRSHHEEDFERVIEAIRAGFPEFRSLDFPLTAAGKAVLLWKEDGRRFQSHQLSEGTLRYLWLAAILLSPRKPPVLLIDEPEVSLHPELLKLLAGLLREAGEQSQVLVATHSDRLLRWLSAEEIVVLDKEDGETQLRRGDDPSLDLDRWLADYTLDELWLMGQLGGRP